MSWVVADLLLFAFSVVIYLAVRKAALAGLPTQFNNMAMFGPPLVIFVIAALIRGDSFSLSGTEALEIFGTAIVCSYLGNVMSLSGIALAPNAGYSLVISKSYVVMTTLLAVVFLNAHLTVRAALAIVVIVIASAFVTVTRKTENHQRNLLWFWYSIGAFICWGLLSLMAKHIQNQGVPTLVFLTYVFSIVVVCISFEMKAKHVQIGVLRKELIPFLAIGVATAGFNYFNFYAIKVAPNVGYVNATNAASIGVVTLVSALVFKDELTKVKLAGVIGVLGGLALLLV